MTMEIFNNKEIVKRIKEASKTRIFWSFRDGTHYIASGHWAIKMVDVPREILSIMLSIFLQKPIEGESLKYTSYSNETVCEKPEKDHVKTLFDQFDYKSPGARITKFKKDAATNLEARVISSETSYFLVQEKYVRMLNNLEVPVNVTSKFQPIYLCDGDFILLPIRESESSGENDSTNELLKGA